MTAQDETTQREREDEQARRRRSWLPWLVLVVVLAVVAWLIWTYSDFGKAPDQADAPTQGSVRSAAVPDVSGMGQEAAVAAVESAGFKAEVESAFDPDAVPGTVVQQDPKGGETAVVGSTVFLGVSAEVGAGTGEEDELEEGEALVPDVIGLTRAQAIAELNRNGLGFAASSVYSDSEPEGLVFNQTPAPGVVASEGAEVGILVSLGRSPGANVTMPNLLRMTEAQAVDAIEDAGLEPRVMKQPKRDSVGRVYEQSPEPGTAVPEGRLVFVLVGVRP